MHSFIKKYGIVSVVLLIYTFGSVVIIFVFRLYNAYEYSYLSYCLVWGFVFPIFMLFLFKHKRNRSFSFLSSIKNTIGMAVLSLFSFFYLELAMNFINTVPVTYNVEISEVRPTGSGWYRIMIIDESRRRKSFGFKFSKIKEFGLTTDNRAYKELPYAKLSGRKGSLGVVIDNVEWPSSIID